MSADLVPGKNSAARISFRHTILNAQARMEGMISVGACKDAMPDCTLTHTFSPIHEGYGCCTYARQMFIPKGTLIVGKIHRHAHHNFIMRGKVSVATEFGKKYIEAPAVFVSEPGLKRAVYAEEDTVWVTVHLTKHAGEGDLDRIEEETIAPSYEAIGLISEPVKEDAL